MIEDFSAATGHFLGVWVARFIIAAIFMYPMLLLWNVVLVPAVTVLNDIELFQAYWVSLFLLYWKPIKSEKS